MKDNLFGFPPIITSHLQVDEPSSTIFKSPRLAYAFKGKKKIDLVREIFALLEKGKQMV